MSFEVKIGSLGGTVFFSGGNLYPSINYGLAYLHLFVRSINQPSKNDNVG